MWKGRANTPSNAGCIFETLACALNSFSISESCNGASPHFLVVTQHWFIHFHHFLLVFILICFTYFNFNRLNKILIKCRCFCRSIQLCPPPPSYIICLHLWLTPLYTGGQVTQKPNVYWSRIWCCVCVCAAPTCSISFYKADSHAQRTECFPSLCWKSKSQRGVWHQRPTAETDCTIQRKQNLTWCFPATLTHVHSRFPRLLCN